MYAVAAAAVVVAAVAAAVVVVGEATFAGIDMMLEMCLEFDEMHVPYVEASIIVLDLASPDPAERDRFVRSEEDPSVVAGYIAVTSYTCAAANRIAQVQMYLEEHILVASSTVEDHDDH
jgi:hypothetical protein